MVVRGLRLGAFAALLVGGSHLVVLLTAGPATDGLRLLRHVTDDAPSTQRGATAGAGVLATGIGAVSAAVLVLAWAWLVAAALTCAVDALRGTSSPVRAPDTARVPPSARISAALRPRLVRVVVGGLLGATSVSATAAHATPGPAPWTTSPLTDRGRAGDADTDRLARLLDGLPLPTRPVDRARPPSSEEASTPHGAPHGHRVVVRPGDTLWSITAGLLPPGSSEERIDAGWRLLYDANRTAVGGDPDLVEPGQPLRVPTGLSPGADAHGHAPDR